MICLLMGHDPQEVSGEDDLKQYSAVICTRCGKEMGPRKGDAKKHPRGYESVAAEFHRKGIAR